MHNLFLVYVGGKFKGSNIEAHDIIFTVGEKFEDTYNQIISKWYGDKNSLHIDSYMKLQYVDGYKLIIINNEHNISLHNKKNKPYLWFAYLGGYEHNNIEESHQISFVVSGSKMRAMKKAKQKIRKEIKMIHIDNIKKLSVIEVKDESLELKSTKWYIDLEEDDLIRSQDIVADWQGYKKLSN